MQNGDSVGNSTCTLRPATRSFSQDVLVGRIAHEGSPDTQLLSGTPWLSRGWELRKRPRQCTTQAVQRIESTRDGAFRTGPTIPVRGIESMGSPTPRRVADSNSQRRCGTRYDCRRPNVTRLVVVVYILILM